MNYLSFSLWGDNPLYNIGAIRNSELIKKIYPGWKMVLYYDNTVPQETLVELKKNDVIIKDVTELNLYGMFWRFLASDIEDGNYVCFRDCDSRISHREFLATQQWINSDKILHVMRDHPAHRIPYGNDQLGILGGMWGIKSKILPMTSLVIKFNEGKKLTYGSDQTFLKYIYQEFINDKITHDEFFDGLPFPIRRENGRFIGERININEQPLTNDHLSLL